MARKFDSEIWVSPTDEWIFRGNTINTEEILKYFRNNLHSNDKGVYIENVFGELVENGYIKIEGFPCHVLHVVEDNGNLFFETDDGRAYPFGEFEIYESEKAGILGIRSGEDRILYRFNWNAAKDLSQFLVEEQDGIYLHWSGIQMKIPEFKGETEVQLPTNYD